MVRKRIKHLHLRVYPPDGRVQVSAPLAISDAALRLAVTVKRACCAISSRPAPTI